MKALRASLSRSTPYYVGGVMRRVVPVLTTSLCASTILWCASMSKSEERSCPRSAGERSPITTAAGHAASFLSLMRIEHLNIWAQQGWKGEPSAQGDAARLIEFGGLRGRGSRGRTT